MFISITQEQYFVHKNLQKSWIAYANCRREIALFPCTAVERAKLLFYIINRIWYTIIQMPEGSLVLFPWRIQLVDGTPDKRRERRES